MKHIKKHPHDTLAAIAFVAAILLAVGAYYLIWNSQAYVGQSIAGTRSLGEIMFKRQALESQQPAPISDTQTLRATQGCCNYLERPSFGSQLKLDVHKNSNYCYADPTTQQMIKSGYKIVDITPGLCPR